MTDADAPQPPSSAGAAPSLQRRARLADVDDRTLRELVEERKRHGKIRLLSVLVMLFTAMGLNQAGLIPPLWGGLVFYGVPVATMIFGDKMLVHLWKRQALAEGISEEAIAAVREHLRVLSQHAGLASAGDLAHLIRRRDRGELQLPGGPPPDQPSS